MIKIVSFYTGDLLKEVDADSLIFANLRSANLSGANLGGANLRSANLSGADLSDANLSGGDVRRVGVGLHPDYLRGYYSINSQHVRALSVLTRHHERRGGG